MGLMCTKPSEEKFGTCKIRHTRDIRMPLLAVSMRAQGLNLKFYFAVLGFLILKFYLFKI